MNLISPYFIGFLPPAYVHMAYQLVPVQVLFTTHDGNREGDI